MKFREACAPYFTDEGLMKNKPSDPDVDGNSLMYTALFYIFLHYTGERRATDKANLQQLILDWAVEPGVMNRGGFLHRNNIQNHDDYIYLLTAAYLYGLSFPSEVKIHGETHFWYFRNTGPHSISNWWWPINAFKAHVVQCAGHELNIFDQVRLWVDVKFTASKELSATSGRLMDFAKSLVLQDQDGCLIGSILNINFVDQTQYEDGLRAIFGIYFSPTHPFALFANKCDFYKKWRERKTQNFASPISSANA